MKPTSNCAQELRRDPETGTVTAPIARSGRAHRARAGVLATAFAVGTAASAFAAAPASVHEYAGLALSPNGARVATVETGPQHRVVVVRSAVDGKITATYDPCGACAYTDPIWSPDGESLAFVGWDSKSRAGWAWVAEGETLHPAARFEGLLAKPRYSPDGKTLAVLATLHPTKGADATSPGARLVGDMDALPMDVRRVALVDSANQQLRLISPADRFVYDYDWTPDGKGFAVIDAIGDADNAWYVARLEAVDLATGAARTLAAPKFQIRMPRVSPDGKTVTFIGGMMDDYGDMSTGGDLWSVPIEGGEPRNLTPEFDGNFNSLMWRAGRLHATAIVFDRFHLFVVEKDGKLNSLWSEQYAIQAGDGRVSLSADGKRMATVMQSFTVAPRIMAGAPTALRPITHDNDGFVAGSDARSISYTNEGLTIQGWLLAPKNLQPGKTYPMAVYVHGGPAHFQQPRFPWDDEVSGLLERGYFVFQPNYRGSFGQGQAFQRILFMDMGGGDLRDILAGVDAVEKIAPVDENRLAIFGHSYGGYMTEWAVTQTNRFKAAAVSAGLSDWVSDYSLNGIQRWQDPYFNGITPYDRQDIFDRISPLRFVKQVKTPTFLYGGDSDVESPIEWGIEFWRALKALGVPVSFVIYPGEGHKFSNPAHQADVTARTLAWFDKYVGDGAR